MDPVSLSLPVLLMSVLGLAVIVLMAAVLFRLGRLPAEERLRELLMNLGDRTERRLAEELQLARHESADSGGRTRTELLERLSSVRQQVLDDARQARIEHSGAFKTLSETVLSGHTSLAVSVSESLASSAQRQADAFSSFRDDLNGRIRELITTLDARIDQLRKGVESQFEQIRADNSKKLEDMRKTVEEKLEGTLERRLGDSFKLVSERLEQVHKGLGEMQSLATGVGDLKRVITNVKVRGTWGEIQLGNLLEQILAPEQFGRNVRTNPNSDQHVEFAIKMPGHSENGANHIWMPIDAKFPVENYQRLVDAQERGDAAACEEAGRLLEGFIKSEARSICEKYLSPPATTDFGILYLPTEGLFAEVIRRTGLVEQIQRDSRVVVAGPTTLTALLNSLQMGFRTLAIQQRSSEVWEVLGAVKAEFGKFEDVLKKVEKKLHEAGSVIEGASRRSRVITRKLKHVQELPRESARRLLGTADTGWDDNDEDQGTDATPDESGTADATREGDLTPG